MNASFTKWLTVMTAPFAWTLTTIVAYDVMFGENVWWMGGFYPFFAANLVVGVVWYFAARWVLTRYADALAVSRPMRWLTHELSGRTLRSALASLEQMESFERDS